MDPATARAGPAARLADAPAAPQAGKPLAARLRAPGPAAIKAAKAFAFTLALLPLARLVLGFY
nr:hypothetical protein [Burkholderiales bacterium]